METTNTFNLNSSHPGTDELQTLREEVEQLNSDLVEATEQRAQAAEYGLVLLEEKQTLQMKYEELTMLYEGTKRELDSSVNALKQVQTDYEKRVKDVESQREQLLDEMETRESTLINKNFNNDEHSEALHFQLKIDKGEEDQRQLERKLKQAVSECECLDEHNNYLNGELDRCRKEIDNFKDENRRLKQEKSSKSLEMEDMRKTSDKLETRVKQLSRLEEECQRLQKDNSVLSEEANSLRELYDNVVAEKDDLESRTQETLEALEEEREVRSILEVQLKEDSAHFPAPHPSWAVEEREGSRESSTARSMSSDHLHNSSVPGSPPTSPGGTGGGADSAGNQFHSTPYPLAKSHHAGPSSHSQAQKEPVSLLSELQQVQSDSHMEELETLTKRISELEEIESKLQEEKTDLEAAMSTASAQESVKIKEMLEAREEMSKVLSEKEVLIDDLQQKVAIRDEQISHYKTKLSSAISEKTSLEIELDGLNSEMKRVKAVSGVELDKVQKECAQEQSRNLRLKARMGELEDQLSNQAKVVERLEAILTSSHGEVSAMTENIKSLQKVVATLSASGKVGPSPSNSEVGPSPSSGESSGKVTSNGVKDAPKENWQLPEEGKEENKYFRLELKMEKPPLIHVHSETHSLKAIANLHEQLRNIRTPLETFTKAILEKSLTQPLKLSSSTTSPRPYSPESIAGANRKNTLDLEASVSKWKSKYLHKAEESSNLRSIMKARATTYDVAVSSMRSKLDSQARAYQSEVTKLKYQIKMLKKDRDEHLSLRNMYSKRCEDYIDEITRSKKLLERRKQEYDEVMVSLQKTIHRKLELSTELEEYMMEQERNVTIPKHLESSRV